MPTHPNLYLSRVDNPSSHGWLVRITRGADRVVRFFSDSKAGGKRLAQQAAKEYRDATLARLNREGKRPRSRKIVFRQRRNKSGIIGVARIQRRGANGSISHYYAVTWRPMPGVQRGTTISIAKYGEAGALKRAIALRNRMLMKRYGSGVFRKIKAMRDNASDIIRNTNTPNGDTITKAEAMPEGENNDNNDNLQK